MTVTFSVWTIPIILTVLLWAAALFWPGGRHGGDYYGFGAAVEALLRLCAALGGTLVIWLAYFVWAFFTGLI